MSSLFGQSSGTDQEEWISVSDLMTGLMVVFLLVSIAYTVQVQDQNRRIRGIAEELVSNENDIHRALEQEFSASERQRWGMKLINNNRERLVVRFLVARDQELDDSHEISSAVEPPIFFEVNDDTIGDEYKSILGEFFPRYVKVLSRYESSISEVRIEGHTSSEWKDETNELRRYLENMKLSQDRARSVLRYVMELQQEGSVNGWPFSHITVNGLSFSKLVRDLNGREVPSQSRRVEFRVRTKARAEIEKIRGESR